MIKFRKRLLVVALGAALSLGTGLFASLSKAEVKAASVIYDYYMQTDSGLSSNVSYKANWVLTDVNATANTFTFNSGQYNASVAYFGANATNTALLVLTGDAFTSGSPTLASLATESNITDITKLYGFKQNNGIDLTSNQNITVTIGWTGGNASTFTGFIAYSVGDSESWNLLTAGKQAINAGSATTAGSLSFSESLGNSPLAGESNVKFALIAGASSHYTIRGLSLVISGDTLSDKTLDSIEVTTQPTKKSYIDGDSFDPSGMVITATYDDESNADVTDSCTYDPSTLTAGMTAVTAEYTENSITKTTQITGLTVSAGPSYSYTAANADLPASTTNGGVVQFGSLSWSVGWTEGPTGSSTVGVSSFDATKGHHYGTNANPPTSVSLRSELFVSPSNETTQISSITLDLSSGANNKAAVKFEVSIGGSLVGSYEPSDASSVSSYVFTPESDAYGHIEIVLTNKLSYVKTSETLDGSAAIYVKSIKVFSNNANSDLASAIQFSSSLESFNSCGDGTGYTLLSSDYSTLSPTAKGYLSSILLDDYNAVGQASGSSIQKDVVSAADKWAYINDRFGGESGANNLDFADNSFLKTIIITSVLGITLIGAAFYLKKKREELE